MNESFARHLNRVYRHLSIEERLHYLYRMFAPKDILVTSSFGVDSTLLLYHLKTVRPDQQIHFINTLYLFEETRAYKEYLRHLWDLEIIEISPPPFQHFKTEIFEMWRNNPDRCCSINKVEVLQPYIRNAKVWISGLMSFQNKYRGELSFFRKSGNLWRFYPLIDLLPQDAYMLKLKYALPPHPLENKGYGSVGCTHCTQRRPSREGRWHGSEKSECGLHLLKSDH